jgi:hypothetical protein
MRRMIDIAPSAAALHTHFTARWINSDALHGREVNDQAIIAGAQPGTVVTPAAHGNQQIVLTAKVDRRDHIGNVDAMRDQQRPLVNHAV